MPFPYTFPINCLIDNVIPVIPIIPTTGDTLPLQIVMVQLPLGQQGEFRKPRDKYKWDKWGLSHR